MIEALAKSDAPRGVTDLACQLDLHKSNVHRMLMTLASQGFVRKEPESGRYALTIRLWELGSYVVNRLNLKQTASPFMRRLAEETRETVHLSVLDGLDVIYIDKIESLEPVRAYSAIGGRSPAYCVATGKAMLAFQPHQVLASIPFQKLLAFTDKTITDRPSFLREMQRVRETGYSVNRGEWRASVRGIAAPIFGSGQTVVAAIGLSGPSERFTQEKIRRYGPLIRGAGEAVSRAFGYTRSDYPPITSDE